MRRGYPALPAPARTAPYPSRSTYPRQAEEALRMAGDTSGSADKTRLDVVLAVAGGFLTGLFCMYYIFAGLLVAFVVPLAVVLLGVLVIGISVVAWFAYRPAAFAFLAAVACGWVLWGLDDVAS